MPFSSRFLFLKMNKTIIILTILLTSFATLNADDDKCKKPEVFLNLSISVFTTLFVKGGKGDVYYKGCLKFTCNNRRPKDRHFMKNSSKLIWVKEEDL